MQQTSISDFFNFPLPKPKPLQKEKQKESSSKELLEPLFTRPIPDSVKYKVQLIEEYELIDKHHFAPVFIQVKRILELIKQISEDTKKPILHIIRGSAGSSLVCFLMGITDIDPILHGIQLARFMNKARKDMPDIDIDIPYNRREEIFTYISKTWPHMVARISNHVTYSSKTALRESIKEVLDVKTMPTGLRKRDFSIEKILPNKEDQKKAKEIASKKVGTIKNYSKHCGGIVIFEEEGEVPKDLIYKSLDNSMVQLKLNKDQTEDAGFIKIDLLCNRGLAQISDICPDRPFTQYPKRDSLTELYFEKGWTIGVTFGESRGMRKLFMEMKPEGVKDIAVALALIRPAAAAEGRKQEFLKKWALPEGKSSNPLERPIVFDDDAIMKIKKALGCDVAEADTWRKAFAKGNSQARLNFRKKMYEKGYDREITDKVIDDLNQLIYYSFCKSHAVSYAQLVWALMYWKVHKPHEFWVAALNHCHSEYRKWVHYREARCSGLLLSRSTPPYKLIQKNGIPLLLSEKGEQTLLKEPSLIEEIKTLGYWTQKEFLPNCGVKKDSQTRLDGKQVVHFRGIIACGRTVTRDWGMCTMICIGTGNREYCDLVIPDKNRNDLFRWCIVEGSGVLVKKDSVEVTTIKGISLTGLLKVSPL